MASMQGHLFQTTSDLLALLLSGKASSISSQSCLFHRSSTTTRYLLLSKLFRTHQFIQILNSWFGWALYSQFPSWSWRYWAGRGSFEAHSGGTGSCPPRHTASQLRVSQAEISDPKQKKLQRLPLQRGRACRFRSVLRYYVCGWWRKKRNRNFDLCLWLVMEEEEQGFLLRHRKKQWIVGCRHTLKNIYNFIFPLTLLPPWRRFNWTFLLCALHLLLICLWIFMKVFSLFPHAINKLYLLLYLYIIVRDFEIYILTIAH